MKDGLQFQKSSQINNESAMRGKFIKRFWWLGLIVIILIIFGVVFVVVKNKEKNKFDDKKFQNQPMFENYDPTINLGLAKCPANLSGLFTYFFINPDNLEAIDPLGGVNPPMHTQPVDHIYFTTKNSLNARVPIYMPADGILFEVVEEVRTNTTTGAFLESSSEVTFAPCQGVDVSIAIISELGPDIKALIKDGQGQCEELEKGKQGEEVVSRMCRYQVDKQLKAGDLLGYELNVSESERLASNGRILPEEVKDVEIWAHNYSITPSRDVDIAWYDFPSLPYSFCFFDMYQGEMQKKYLDKFGAFNSAGYDGFKQRIAPPVCGSILQNIVGTVQGDWFYGEKGKVSSDGYLSLVPNNFDPSIGDISIGGTIRQPEVINFLSTHSGTLNRELSEVKTDNNIYCYQADADSKINSNTKREITEKILLNLVDDHHLKIENQPGACGAGETFKNPFIYQR
jgi:hypothetical protein